MLVQSTPDLVRGTSGPVRDDVSVADALRGLRDALAAGEVSTAQAASKLTAILACLRLSTIDPFGPTRDASGDIRPPRFTFAGYCGECFKPDCRDPECIRSWKQPRWVICSVCSGTGYKDHDHDDASVACDACFNGVHEVASSAMSASLTADSHRHPLVQGAPDLPIGWQV